jgi:hypothetical protein
LVNDLLKKQNLRLEAIAWNTWYKKIKFEINQLESKMKISKNNRSCPMYFNNIKPSVNQDGGRK